MLAGLLVPAAAAGCAGGATGAVPVPVPTPSGPAVAACARLVAALPTEIVPGARRRRTEPPSPATAAFGAPPIVVRCGVPVPPHPPSAFIATVDGVDWLAITVRGGATAVALHSSPVVSADIPDRYVGADVLAVLSPLLRPQRP